MLNDTKSLLRLQVLCALLSVVIDGILIGYAF